MAPRSDYASANARSAPASGPSTALDLQGGIWLAAPPHGSEAPRPARALPGVIPPQRPASPPPVDAYASIGRPAVSGFAAATAMPRPLHPGGSRTAPAWRLTITDPRQP